MYGSLRLWIGSSKMNVYERESKEFLRAVVYKGSEILIDGVYFAVVGLNERPTEDDWVPALVLDGKTGLIIEGFGVGNHTVWARVIENPEDVVKKIGNFKVV